MRQVTGAYYFRPGISYDFMRTAFGKLAGARLDFIWSRATSFLQTWGNDPDLGIEIDASLYFHSEGGPQLTDGFQAMLQYGVLFPMRGLSYLHEDTNLDTAQTLRCCCVTGGPPTGSSRPACSHLRTSRRPSI